MATEQELAKREEELTKGLADLKTKKDEFANYKDEEMQSIESMKEDLAVRITNSKEEFEKYVKSEQEKLGKSGSTGLVPQPKSVYKDGAKEKRDKETKLAEEAAQRAKDAKKDKSQD